MPIPRAAMGMASSERPKKAAKGLRRVMVAVLGAEWWLGGPIRGPLAKAMLLPLAPSTAAAAIPPPCSERTVPPSGVAVGALATTRCGDRPAGAAQNAPAA